MRNLKVSLAAEAIFCCKPLVTCIREDEERIGFEEVRIVKYRLYRPIHAISRGNVDDRLDHPYGQRGDRLGVETRRVAGAQQELHDVFPADPIFVVVHVYDRDSILNLV